MKVAIITDQHFGARGDHHAMLDHQEKFYKNVFFPKIDEEGITTILDLGDTFDRRKYVNFNTLNRSKEFYFNQIQSRGCTLHTIVGNHTAFYKNTNRVNTLNELFSNYTCIQNYDKATEIVLDKKKILLVPWITKDNYDHTIQMIDTTKATVAMGHFEFRGFQMYRGAINEHGYSHTMFSRFDQVFSGHFHHKSQRDNVTYLGAPYEMTWSDFGDSRGFHLYETNTGELTYIQNPYNLFHKIFYDDIQHTLDEYLSIDLSKIHHCYVKIIIKNKENPYQFDRFVDYVNSFDPIHLQVVDDNLNLNSIDDDDIIDQAQDTLTIIRSYIDNLSIERGDRVKSIMNELYNEAMRSDS